MVNISEKIWQEYRLLCSTRLENVLGNRVMPGGRQGDEHVYSVDKGREKELTLIVSTYWSLCSNYCARYYYTDFLLPCFMPYSGRLSVLQKRKLKPSIFSKVRELMSAWTRIKTYLGKAAKCVMRSRLWVRFRSMPWFWVKITFFPHWLWMALVYKQEVFIAHTQINLFF